MFVQYSILLRFLSIFFAVFLLFFRCFFGVFSVFFRCFFADFLACFSTDFSEMYFVNIFRSVFLPLFWKSADFYQFFGYFVC